MELQIASSTSIQCYFYPLACLASSTGNAASNELLQLNRWYISSTGTDRYDYGTWRNPPVNQIITAMTTTKSNSNQQKHKGTPHLKIKKRKGPQVIIQLFSSSHCLFSVQTVLETEWRQTGTRENTRRKSPLGCHWLWSDPLLPKTEFKVLFEDTHRFLYHSEIGRLYLG